MRSTVPKMAAGLYPLDVPCAVSQFARVGLSLKEPFENLVQSLCKHDMIPEKESVYEAGVGS